MKITNVKAMVIKGVTVSLLAGAFALAAPVKADAQQLAVVVPVGYPHYDYARRGYDDHLRLEQERHHEEWVRAHEYARNHHEYVYRGRW